MLYFLFIAIVLDYLYFKLKYTTPRGPPVWYGLPFVGILPLMLLPNFVFRPLFMLYLKHGPDMIITRILGAVVLTKGEAARAMYANENCQSKPSLKPMNYLGYIMTGKHALVYTDGGKIDWRAHRKIDVAALYALPKREMVLKSSEVVDVFLREIAKHEDEPWDCDHELAVAKYQESANLNLGATFRAEDIKQFVKCVVAIFRKAIAIIMLLYAVSPTTLERLEGFLPKEVRPTLVARVYKDALGALISKRSQQKQDDRTRDFLAATLKVKKPKEAHEYLCMASLFLMAANTHSTHHTILSGLQLLAKNPEIQRKLYKEVRMVLGTEALTLDHINEMPYLRACVMESIRLHSPFPYNLRHCIAPTNICGYDIPGDMSVCVMIHRENWDPQNFPQPLTFRPERFIDENGKYFKDPNLGVFGGGKRECPGKNIAQLTASVFISKILQYYEVRPGDITAEPADTLTAFIPPPAKIPLRFIRRNKDLALPTTQPSTELSALFEEVLAT